MEKRTNSALPHLSWYFVGFRELLIDESNINSEYVHNPVGMINNLCGVEPKHSTLQPRGYCTTHRRGHNYRKKTPKKDESYLRKLYAVEKPPHSSCFDVGENQRIVELVIFYRPLV